MVNRCKSNSRALISKLHLTCYPSSDIWAIGVITYFLLCGYTPFDRDSNLEEMQAILQADYSFTPIEYWRNVTMAARDFIKQCLTVDPRQRMTAHQALNHPWINTEDPLSPVQQTTGGTPEDLLPTVKKNFNARRTLHKAIDTVRAINKLREGGGLMSGHGAVDHMQIDPKPKKEDVHGSRVMDEQGTPVDGGAAGGGLHDHGGDSSQGQGSSAVAGYGAGSGDAMDIDSRGNAHGQTQDQIQRQSTKVQNQINETYQKIKGGLHKS